MPPTRLVFFRNDDGTVPLLEWLDSLPTKARVKCIARLARLALVGYELRRPEADFLKDGVYELRVGLRGTNYRMLYFFHGQTAVVVSHGLVKQRVVPPREIDLAIQRRSLFEKNPGQHSHEQELDNG